MSDHLKVLEDLGWQYFGKASGIMSMFGGGCVPVNLSDIEEGLPKFCIRCRSGMAWRGDIRIVINDETFDPKTGDAFETQMLACPRSYYGMNGKRPCSWTQILRRRHVRDGKVPRRSNMVRRSINENPGMVFGYAAYSLTYLVIQIIKTVWK